MSRQTHLEHRLAQAMGVRPFDVSIRFVPSKRRRELLLQEALRQAELTELARLKLLAAGELWAPSPGTRLARDWEAAKALALRIVAPVSGEVVHAR